MKIKPTSFSRICMAADMAPGEFGVALTENGNHRGELVLRAKNKLTILSVHSRYDAESGLDSWDSTAMKRISVGVLNLSGFKLEVEDD